MSTRANSLSILEYLEKIILWVKPVRPMKYPYTFCAKIAQFPYMYYYKHSWVYRYYPYGWLASVPVFLYLSKLSNSRANKEKWAEIRRKEREEEERRHH